MRLRKQTDGSFNLNTVENAPSGLSHAGQVETTVLVLTQAEVDQIVKDAADGTGPLDPQVSDTSKAAGLSNLKE